MENGKLKPGDVQNFIQKWRVYREDVNDPAFKSNEEIVALQNTLLSKQIKRLAEGSGYYKKLFNDCIIDPASIRTIDDLEKLPLTKKSDYMVDPESFRLNFAENRVENNLWEVNYTAGTTSGKPSPFYTTVHDMYGCYLAGMRASKIAMLPPAGITVNLYPFGPLPHIGYTRLITRTLGTTRAFVTPSIGMKYDEIPIHRSMDFALDLVESLKPNHLLLTGIPSFIRRFILTAEKEKRDFSNVTDIHLGGEPFNKNARDDMRLRMDNLGAKNVRILNIYGFTELQTTTVECCEFSGNHISSLDLHYFEVVDNNGKRLPDGETGNLALTHLNARGTSLVRFLVGDLVRIVRDACPYCGRRGGRLMPTEGSIIVTRSSELIKVKGTLINPNLLKEGLLGIKGIGEYQIIIDYKDPRDTLSGDSLIIKIYTESDSEKIKKDIIDMCRNTIEMTPRVDFVEEASEIFDTTKSLKSVRVIDRRSK